MEYRTLKVTKIEAAHRQLNCAIELWFKGGDPVAIHTLAAASNQIVNDLLDRKKLPASLYAVIKPEHRRRVKKAVDAPANFLKHARNDPDEITELNEFLGLGLIIFAVGGLGALGEEMNEFHNTLLAWLTLHEPTLIADSYVKTIAERVPVNVMNHLRTVQKQEFFEIAFPIYKDAANARKLGRTLRK